MSPPEVLLWNELRGSKLGVKVRRQHPVGPYIADFFVRQANLVIEVDGNAHDFGERPQSDTRRDQYMIDRGLRVVRIPARDVMTDLNAVLKLIAVQVTSPLHHPTDGPPPRAGEEL